MSVTLTGFTSLFAAVGSMYLSGPDSLLNEAAAIDYVLLERLVPRGPAVAAVRRKPHKPRNARRLRLKLLGEVAYDERMADGCFLLGRDGDGDEE